MLMSQINKVSTPFLCFDVIVQCHFNDFYHFNVPNLAKSNLNVFHNSQLTLYMWTAQMMAQNQHFSC